MKINFLIVLSLFFLLIACQEKPKINVELEKEEVIQFLRDYTSYINKNSIEGFENYWQKSSNVSYIPLERDSAIIGSENIREYLKNHFNEITNIEYSTWNSDVWVNPTKSEAVIIFLSSKNIQFKNGFKINFSPVRNSATLSKFEGKWKLINLHESVRQK